MSLRLYNTRARSVEAFAPQRTQEAPPRGVIPFPEAVLPAKTVQGAS